MIRLLLIITVFIFYNSVEAQKCYAEVIKQRAISNNSLIIDSIEKIEEFTKNFNSTSRSVITIPVVIHVVWYDTIEDISFNQIQSQIDVLNEDFRGVNPDTTYVPIDFKHLIADSEIEFCLASYDTNGFPTNGIVRVQTSIQDIGDVDTHGSKVQHTAQGGSDAWNTSHYLNIWVTSFGSSPTLGYAYYPGTAPPGEDGAVIDYRKFGTIGTVSPPNDYGRTVTHEIGHYFNLKHIWGDNGGCSDDDLVNDTPMQDSANFGTPIHPDYSCSSPDMFMNFMDYVDDDYMNMFSIGQKQRMLAALNGPRVSLLSSTGCGFTSGIHQSNNHNGISIYPNPATNTLNVSLKDNTDRLVGYTLYAVNGKKIAEGKLEKTQVDLSDIQSGTYFITFSTTKNHSITKRIQKL